MFIQDLFLSSIEPLRGLVGGDLIILGYLVLVSPILSDRYLKNDPIQKLKENPKERMATYNQTIIMLWATAIAITLLWKFTGRGWDSLGFIHRSGPGLYVAWIIVGIGLSYSAFQLYQVKTNPSARSKIKGELKKVGELTNQLMPKTSAEYHRSMVLGITAGITEEIIFRGFVIFALSLFMNIWLAGFLSLALFVFLHRYQEKSGLIQVSLFAAVATFTYLISGSLLPAIILHIGFDVLHITLAWELEKFQKNQHV